MFDKNCISDFQLYLHQEGTNYESYRMLGSHKMDGGYHFAVWAPNAASVSVVGDFNNWEIGANYMYKHQQFGVFTLFIPDLGDNERYKYYITTKSGEGLYKADPYAFYSELRPNTASITYDFDYNWGDYDYLRDRQPVYDKPMVVYEVHAGTWKRKEENKLYSYSDLKDELIPYAKMMGFTHIEMLPLHEHPFDGSWGYQVTGFYAVTCRYGTPRDFMEFVDAAHAQGIGVILDWVPAHFPKDAHGLSMFDGTHLYEAADSRIGEHMLWGTKAFNLNRAEVISFLISNAMFWFDIYHVDGLRVDAVSALIYRDYQREPGQWLPNKYGGNTSIEGIEFVKRLNNAVHKKHPTALMIAEESTAFPGITRSPDIGGLGFNYKWNMGWMNDMMKYIKVDPLDRKYLHNLLTFSMMYAFNETYILPLSHDEVVHGKKSLLDKMPGDYWQKFAGLRMFFAYMFAHPGKKLVFMGGEFGQFIEWKDDDSLDWHLMDLEMHGKLHLCYRHIIDLYKKMPAFYEEDTSWDGYRWLKTDDSSRSIVAFMRIAKRSKSKDSIDKIGDHVQSILKAAEAVSAEVSALIADNTHIPEAATDMRTLAADISTLAEEFAQDLQNAEQKSDIYVICNFTPRGYDDYYIGVPTEGAYEEILNTDNTEYGGTNMLNGKIQAEQIICDGYPFRLRLKVPPLSTIYLKHI